MILHIHITFIAKTEKENELKIATFKLFFPNAFASSSKAFSQPTYKSIFCKRGEKHQLAQYRATISGGLI